MANDPSLRIDIAAEFVGRKAFKQADTATEKLTKSVKKLGGVLGISLGARALVNFSKNAIKAFAADEAAAMRLSTAVENLGIGFANPNITKFISDLEKSSAIADDILRPAFQGLLTTTGSLVQSQKLLNDAITISRASGIDLATVSQDLAKGYVGITRGLAKYNTGLTTTEISTKSFSDILGILLTKSAGAATDYLGTTQYALDTLSIATGNASEILGKGLVDALARIGGGSEASDAAYAIQAIATAIANVTRAVGTVVGAIPNLLKVLGKLPKDIFMGFAGASAGVKLTPVAKPPAPTATELAQKELLAKLEANATKRQKELLALQNKQTLSAKLAAAARSKSEKLAAAAKKKADTLSAALSKAAAVFDISKIQIAAALRATFDKDNRLRLLAMQAIENDNGEAALLYIKQLDLLTKEQQTNKLAGITNISENELNYINQLLLDELQRIKTTKMSEQEAALARQDAYAKYNAAIQQSGGLAEANFYTEKTQVELLSIAKLAALDTVAAAQATIDLLNYTSQTDIIARIAAAQKLADDAKYKALQDYLALLGKQLPTPAAPAPAPSSIVPFIPDYGTYGYENLLPPITSITPNSSSANNLVTINVAGSVLDGNEFIEIINNAVLQGRRTGLSQAVAGELP